MALETPLWKWLSARLPPGHFTRVESHETAPGFPDVHYTIQGCTGSMELKATDHASRAFGKKGLRRSQLMWIEEELEARGRVWIVARWEWQVVFIYGNMAEWFNAMTVTKAIAHSELAINIGKGQEREHRELISELLRRK